MTSPEPIVPGKHNNALSLIEQQSAVWRSKAALREVYGDYHRRLADMLNYDLELPIAEIGGGAGHFKARHPDTLCLDIVASPAADILADAHELPFAEGTLGGIVLLDVLHHLADPARFFAEVERVLAVGGRCVMIEPAMTPLARFFYANFHREAVDMSVDPLAAGAATRSDKDPMDSNQAIPWLVFRRSGAAARFEQANRGLRIIRNELLSLFAYPLCGGFQSWSAVPKVLVHPLLGLERMLEPVLGSLAAFRMMVVLEKHDAAAARGAGPEL